MEKLIALKLKDNEKVIKKILSRFFPIRIFLLTGSLGSGKTTLIQQLAKFLKIKENLTSPTFILWQKYKFKYKNRVYYLNHLDLYRLKAKDILKINFKKEIEKKNNIFFVEWGEKLKPWLKRKREKYCQIIIQKNGRQRIFFLK